MEHQNPPITLPPWLGYLFMFLIVLFAYLGEKKIDKEMDTNGIYVLGKVTKPGKLRVEFEFIYKGILIQLN